MKDENVKRLRFVLFYTENDLVKSEISLAKDRDQCVVYLSYTLIKVSKTPTAKNEKKKNKLFGSEGMVLWKLLP